MKKAKIFGMVLFSCLLSACAPYAYKQGPNSFTVLANAAKPANSVVKAKYKAQQVCETYGASAMVVDVKTTPGGIDKVKVIDNYLYVIEDAPSTDYFTVLQAKCVVKRTS